MFANLSLFRLSGASATHAGTRQAVLSQNIANADTPGYLARDLPAFSDQVTQPPMRLRHSRDGHLRGRGVGPNDNTFIASAPRSPNGNSVSLEAEMMKAAVTKQQHDRALAIYKSALGVMRTAISGQ